MSKPHDMANEFCFGRSAAFQPGACVVFLRGDLCGVMQDDVGEFLGCRVRAKRSRERRSEIVCKIDMLNAALLQKTDSRSPLRRACDFLCAD